VPGYGSQALPSTVAVPWKRFPALTPCTTCHVLPASCQPASGTDGDCMVRHWHWYTNAAVPPAPGPGSANHGGWQLAGSTCPMQSKPLSTVLAPVSCSRPPRHSCTVQPGALHSRTHCPARCGTAEQLALPTNMFSIKVSAATHMPLACATRFRSESLQAESAFPHFHKASAVTLASAQAAATVCHADVALKKHKLVQGAGRAPGVVSARAALPKLNGTAPCH
jgi:hypothetical protein